MTKTIQDMLLRGKHTYNHAPELLESHEISQIKTVPHILKHHVKYLIFLNVLGELLHAIQIYISRKFSACRHLPTVS